MQDLNLKKEREQRKISQPCIHTHALSLSILLITALIAFQLTLTSIERENETRCTEDMILIRFLKPQTNCTRDVRFEDFGQEKGAGERQQIVN